MFLVVSFFHPSCEVCACSLLSQFQSTFKVLFVFLPALALTFKMIQCAGQAGWGPKQLDLEADDPKGLFQPRPFHDSDTLPV